MKRFLRNDVEPIKRIQVIVEIELISLEKEVAAAKKISDLPKGELLPAEKDALISTQALEDFHAFIDSIEDLITDYYGLHIFYKNDSPDNSFYYGVVVKDDEGNLIIDFDCMIRISNHPAHRSSESQYNKKEKDAKLAELTKGKKTRPLRRYILVNRDKFDSYDEAYLYVDSQIESAVEIMKRRLTR